MKVWLDSNYNIVRDDGCNKFTKGNNLYDRITVYILTESIANDNILPSFNFLLSNGRKYGPLVYNVESSVEGEYTLFTYALTDNLLSSEGALQITISINFYNTQENVVKIKNINVLGNVIGSVIVNDDIIVVGNQENIVSSLVEDMSSLNKRLTDGLVAIDRADKDSQGNVIHETYETKADAETEYSAIRSVVQTKYEETIGYTDSAIEKENSASHMTFETKDRVARLIGELKTALTDGTLKVSKANEAEYYQEEDTLTSIKAKFADITYLINELANTDLTGLLGRIQVLEIAWNKFMSENGDTAEVIDTLNEIQTAISDNIAKMETKVSKEEGKSLISDELIEFVEEEASYNLLNNVDVTQGTTDVDGKPTGVGEATRVVTNGFISVEPNRTYSVDTRGDFLIYEVNYFDNNQNTISLNTLSETTHTFTTPSNCYYIVVLFRKDVNNSIITVDEVRGSAVITHDAPYRRLTTNDVDYLKILYKKELYTYLDNQTITISTSGLNITLADGLYVFRDMINLYTIFMIIEGQNGKSSIYTKPIYTSATINWLDYSNGVLTVKRTYGDQDNWNYVVEDSGTFTYKKIG